jgi:siroheme synthase (precorrin-2 oxidase/ferrochelatase)
MCACLARCCRSEKKLLNEINHSKEAEQLRFHVMADKDSSRVKERIATAGEKLFILVSVHMMLAAAS